MPDPPLRTRSEVNRLVRENLGIAFAVGRRWSRGRGDADVDDLVQVAALGLVRAAERWDGSRPFAPLAFRCASQAVWSHRRRFRSIVATPSAPVGALPVDVAIDADPNVGATLVADGPSPLALIEDLEAAQRLRSVLSNLPAVDRDALERVYFVTDTTCASAGVAVGIGREAMRLRTDRALRRLRKRMGAAVEPSLDCDTAQGFTS